MNKNATIKNIYEKYADDFNNKIASLSNYLPTYKKLLEYIKNDFKILDLACGPANISKYIKEINKTVKIIGVDFSENILEIAKKKIPDGVFINQDIKKIDLKDTFDVIIFGFGLPYLDLVEFNSLLKMIDNLLNQNGILYISFMDGTKSGYEKTSFTKDDFLYVYYHRKETILDLLEGYKYKLLDEFILNYKEMDGSLTKDIIYILNK